MASRGLNVDERPRESRAVTRACVIRLSRARITGRKPGPVEGSRPSVAGSRAPWTRRGLRGHALPTYPISGAGRVLRPTGIHVASQATISVDGVNARVHQPNRLLERDLTPNDRYGRFRPAA